MLSKRGMEGRGNIAQLLTNQVHFAAFARLRPLDRKFRKYHATSDERCLLVGVRKTAYPVRIPVGWLFAALRLRLEGRVEEPDAWGRESPKRTSPRGLAQKRWNHLILHNLVQGLPVSD